MEKPRLKIEVLSTILDEISLTLITRKLTFFVVLGKNGKDLSVFNYLTSCGKVLVVDVQLHTF